MSWPHHIGETHQPDWVVNVRDSEKFRLTKVIPERIIFVSRGITVQWHWWWNYRSEIHDSIAFWRQQVTYWSDILSLDFIHHLVIKASVGALCICVTDMKPHTMLKIQTSRLVMFVWKTIFHKYSTFISSHHDTCPPNHKPPDLINPAVWQFQRDEYFTSREIPVLTWEEAVWAREMVWTQDRGLGGL